VWLVAVLLRYGSVETVAPLVTVGRAAVWLAVFTLACLGAGTGLLKLTGRCPRAEAVVVTLVGGAGVLVAVGAAVSLAGWLRRPVLAAVLVVAALAGAAAVARSRPFGRVRLAPGLLAPALVLVAATLTTLPILAVLSPFYDQFNYHLAFPYQWLREGHVFVYPRHTYSYLTANMGLLYAFGMSVGGPWTGQAVNWWMGAVATAGFGLLGRRLGGPRAGWWAAAMFATAPTVLQPSTWAGSDLGVAAFASAAWLILLRQRDGDAGETTMPWLLVGALAGLAAGCKYLALAMVAIPLGVATVAARRGAPARLAARSFGLFVAGATVAFSPWMIRNAALTGNPVFPFLNGVFPPRTLLARQGPGEVEAAARVAQFPANRLPPLDRLSLGTFHPQGAAGAIGPLFLGLAPLAAWAAWCRRRRRADLLAAGIILGVAGWWFAPQLGRYLAPVLGLLAALAAAGWSRMRRELPRWWRWAAATALLVVMAWNVQPVAADALDRLACVLGRSSEERQLAERVSYWPAIEYIKQTLPRDAVVMLLAESRTLLLDRALVVEDPYRTPLLVEIADRARDRADAVAELRRIGVTHVLYNTSEAERIAQLTHRGKYLEPSSAHSAEILGDLLEHSLSPVFQQGEVTVFVLRD
jgi:hypothetical protein